MAKNMVGRDPFGVEHDGHGGVDVVAADGDHREIEEVANMALGRQAGGVDRPTWSA